MNIKIEDLVKRYQGKPVLKIDRLNIEKGSVVGIVGPNGAGKSTLAKIIGGLEEKNEGRIFYDGELLNSTHYQDMTVVFQRPYLLRTTVFENVAYPLRLRNVKGNRMADEVCDLLEKLDICTIKDRKAWTLSGGETQKVALARALVFKPSLLILDEPTSNIDPQSIVLMEQAISQYHRQSGATVMLVTHNMQQAMRLCDQVVFMDSGCVEAFGETKKMLFECENGKARRFVENEAMIREKGRMDDAQRIDRATDKQRN